MKRITATYMNVDSEEQAGLGKQSERLVVGDVFSVVAHRVVHRGIGQEKEHERAVAAVQQDLKKFHHTEVHVLLPRCIQLRVLEAPAVVNILRVNIQL